MTEWMYYDHQGEQFTVEAESEAVADAIAKAEADARTHYAHELAQALGDERIVAINSKIQSTYDAAMYEHNAAIAFGTDPDSHLRGVRGKVHDVSANVGGYGTSVERNGYPQARAATLPRAKGDGLTCAELALIAVVAIVLIGFMMVMS